MTPARSNDSNPLSQGMPLSAYISDSQLSTRPNAQPPDDQTSPFEVNPNGTSEPLSIGVDPGLQTDESGRTYVRSLIDLVRPSSVTLSMSNEAPMRLAHLCDMMQPQLNTHSGTGKCTCTIIHSAR